MDYQLYVEQCKIADAENPSWRQGQVLFNVLSEHRPDLAQRVHGTELDPFYANHSPRSYEKIEKFMTFVRENW